MIHIQGRKKGAGGGATEARDSLRSKSVVRVLDAISEGEIVGLTNGARSIYIDGVPLQNANGDYNFEDVVVELRNGTQNQQHIAGFPNVENEVTVGVEVKTTTPAVRTITNANVDAVVVKASTPQLSETDTKNGNIGGSKVEIAIDVQSNGGGFVEVKRDVIEGKTMSRYERSYHIPLNGDGPWDVRMRRITPDSTSSAIANKVYFSALTEVIETKLSYPNTAIVGISISAEHFSNVPTRSYDVKLLKVRVPTNYNPETRAYTGVWDGSFKIAWTDNPAWCYYDLLTSERYGLGRHISEASVDKWALYKIARYCDEMVPNGRGGFEPRFSLNIYLQTRTEAYRLISDLASVFRGMTYWSAGNVCVVQDAPADPSYLFTNSNVVNGDFNYQGTSSKSRHTVALVSWNDLEDLGRQKIEYVEDEEGIRTHGVIQTEVTAFGCTSRAQAHRVGRWILYSELNETETVTFKAGIEGGVARPGQIILVRDNNRYSENLGGRIVSASSGTLVLDRDVDVAAGSVIHVILPNGTVDQGIIDQTSTGNTIHTTGIAMPAPGSTWIISKESEGETRHYRVVFAREEDGTTYEISAVEHDPAKFAKIDSAVSFDSFENDGVGGIGGGGNHTGGVNAPTGLKLEVVRYMEGESPRAKILVSWDFVEGCQWDLEWQRGTDSPVGLYSLTENNYTIPDVLSGYFYVRVRAKKRLALDAAPVNSEWAFGPATFVGDPTPMAPTYLVATPGFLQNSLSWNFPVGDYAISRTEIWAMPDTLGVSSDISNASLLANVPYPQSTYVHTGLEPGKLVHYWVRLVNQFGVEGSFYPIGHGVTAAARLDMTEIFDRITDSITDSEFYQDLSGRISLIELPNLTDVYDRIDFLQRAQDKDGDLLLRNVLADEVIRSEINNGMAQVWEAISVVQDGQAIEASRTSLLEARLDDTSAAVVGEQRARAEGDEALASQTLALVARLDNFGENGDTTIEAAFISEQEARVTADAANASAVSGLIARLDNSGEEGVSIEARISEEQSARVTADAANAHSITQVSSRLNNIDGVTIEEKFSTQASEIEGLSAQYTVKIDNAGYVSGFGLASTPVDGVPQSSFIVLADKFAVVTPGETPRSPFYIGPLGDLQITGDFQGTLDGESIGDVMQSITDAQTAASNAETSATTALNTLADIASDSKLTPSEKQKAKLEWDAIVAEKAGINSQAGAFGITTENNDYNSAYTALSTYIASLLSDLDATSTIVGETFREKFATYYTKRQALLNKISAEAGKRATWSSVSGAGKPEDGATLGAQIGVNLSKPTGGTAYGSDFVAAWNKISSVNIASFMENAVIGSAWIGTAAIGTAHIQNGSVGTAKIADLSVDFAKIKDLEVGGQKLKAPTTGSVSLGPGGSTVIPTWFSNRVALASIASVQSAPNGMGVKSVPSARITASQGYLTITNDSYDPTNETQVSATVEYAYM